MSHHVYVVRCADGTLYTGYTTDIERRVATHNRGRGARYTAARRPVTLIGAWSFDTKSEALRAEYRIRTLSRRDKLAAALAAAARA